jgi:hypothetical protein
MASSPGTTDWDHDRFFSRTAEPFSQKPVHKRVTDRDTWSWSLIVSLDFSRAAGDMGLETGLSSSPGARGKLKRTVMMLTVWCHSG